MSRYAGQQSHSEAVKAACLTALDSGLTQRETAQTFGVPEGTIATWAARNSGITPAVLEKQREQRAKLADLLEEIAYKACGIAPDKLDQAGYGEIMRGTCEGIKTMRLLRNESTEIVEALDGVETVEDRDAKLAEIVEQVQLRVVNGGG